MTLLKTQTRHVQRGTLAFMAPEQLPGKSRLKNAGQQDLYQCDIWQLGMTIFCIMNPCLTSPFQTELKRVSTEVHIDQFIANFYDSSRLPEMSQNYHVHRIIYWQNMNAYFFF